MQTTQDPVGYECYWDDFGCRNMVVLSKTHPLFTDFSVRLGDGVPQPTSYAPVYLHPPIHEVEKNMQTTDELVDEYNSRRRTERIMAGIKPLLLIVLGILLGVCAVTYGVIQ